MEKICSPGFVCAKSVFDGENSNRNSIIIDKLVVRTPATANLQAVLKLVPHNMTLRSEDIIS